MIGLPLSCLLPHQSKNKENSEEESINEQSLDKPEDTSVSEIRKLKIKKYLLIFIPFLLDTIGTFLSKISIVFMSVSIYIIIKNMTAIIITLLLSKFCLKNKHIIDHYISIPIIIIGYVFVGISLGFYYKNCFIIKEDIIIVILGIVFLLISALFNLFN